MTNRVIGPGVTLPPPQTPYPSNLWPSGVPFTPGNNQVTLAPGQSIQLPAGDWFYDLGKYSILEILDPVESGATPTNIAGVWRPIRTQRGTGTVRSDGNNYRISNLLGCPVGAVITNGGSSYVQASTTVTPSTGNSTWQAIVGGRVSNISLTALGAGYGVAPLVFIPAPPAPGIAAAAYATISGGALTGITITTAGAGYTSVPAITIVTNPYDPNIASITAATASALTTGSGAVSGIVCTNPGAPVTTSLSLTVGGVGTSALITPLVLTTVSLASLTALGSGTITGLALTTAYAAPPTAAFSQASGFIPRPAQIAITTSGSVASGLSITDGGMGLTTVFPIFQAYGGLIVNSPTVALTAGSVPDTIIIQPL